MSFDFRDIYGAASDLGLAIGTPQTSWTVTASPSGLGGAPTSAGTIKGFACQGKLGQQSAAAPGSPVVPLPWFFVPTSGTLSAGQRIAYSGTVFTVAGLVAQNGVYAIERA